MNPKLNIRCPLTDKVIYSEAAAARAVDSVEGAIRYYLCADCNGFHITSQSKENMISRGLEVWERPSPKCTINKKSIKKQISKLKKRLGL